MNVVEGGHAAFPSSANESPSHGHVGVSAQWIEDGRAWIA